MALATKLCYISILRGFAASASARVGCELVRTSHLGMPAHTTHNARAQWQCDHNMHVHTFCVTHASLSRGANNIKKNAATNKHNKKRTPKNVNRKAHLSRWSANFATTNHHILMILHVSRFTHPRPCLLLPCDQNKRDTNKPP